MHRRKTRRTVLTAAVAALIGVVAIVFGLVPTSNNAHATTPNGPWKLIGTVATVKKSAGGTEWVLTMPKSAKADSLTKGAHVIVINATPAANSYPPVSWRVLANKNVGGVKEIRLTRTILNECTKPPAPVGGPNELYTGPCDKPVVPGAGPANHLSGVFDIVVDAGLANVDFFHCISRTDIDNSGVVKTAAVCFDNTGALGQGNAAEPIHGAPGEGPNPNKKVCNVPGPLNCYGPPPPPPYGVAPPAKGNGTYIGDNLITTTCFPDVGKSVNIIAVVNIPGAQAQLAATGVLVGTVNLYTNQPNAACDALVPAGPPPTPIGVTNYPATDIPACPAGICQHVPWRLAGNVKNGYPDWDQDGCNDADELWQNKPNSATKCGDDPWNKYDVVGTDASGSYDITAIAARQDCNPALTGNPAVCELPGDQVPGFYYDCKADIQQSGKNLTARLLCYTDSPVVVVNPKAVSLAAEQCGNALDDDNDGAVNDGCPAVATSPAEAGAQCGADTVDSDKDGKVNDGCPTVAGVDSITAPDMPGNVGRHTSLALDAAGNPVVSYYDETNTDLKVLHCGNANCTAGNSIESPDPAGGADVVGQNSSLALDAAGNPVVSYVDSTNVALKVLHCNDANCDSAVNGAESITSPVVGTFGGHISLALDALGNPVVSYYGGGLKVLHCDDPNCAPGGDIINTPDTGGNAGQFSSLALDASDNPVVSYFDGDSFDLKVLHCNDANCAPGGDSVTSPDTGDVGFYISLALDASGNPVVSYQDTTSGDLKVLHCDDPNCAGGGESITAPATLAAYISLALDALGNPVVSYYAGTNGLKVLHCDDPNCAGVETPTTPDTQSLAGLFTSLALDCPDFDPDDRRCISLAGNPVVSYGDDINENLKVLHCNDANCAPGDAELGTACTNNFDDDKDGAVNDGCPAVTTDPTPAESGFQCGADAVDNDKDGLVNDGCPVVFNTLTTCPPAPAAFCGDGVSGAPPPGTTVGTYNGNPYPLGAPRLFAKIGAKHTVLNGVVDNAQNVIKLNGCFQSNVSNPPASKAPGTKTSFLGDVWWDAVINLHTGHGQVRTWSQTAQGLPPCKNTVVPLGSTPPGATQGGILPLHIVRQAFGPKATALVSLSWAGGVVTATTAQPHQMVMSVPAKKYKVKIQGAAPAGYNGNYQVTITGPNTFTYPKAFNPGANIAPGNYGTERDSDGDGCSDKKELGDNRFQGGLRDPYNHYDYFNPTGDKLNRVDDILVVLSQYFIDDPIKMPDLNSKTDRTGIPGGNPWNLGPPNGQQRVDDILNAVKQYFHDC